MRTKTGLRRYGGILALAGGFAAGTVCLPARQQEPVPRLTLVPPLLIGVVGEVAISSSEIAFAYMGDLWSISRSGGTATRLTDTPAEEEAFPVFSPDGQLLAFARGAADIDVYVMPARGGVARRLTYFPKPDVPVAWTPDGQDILFSTSRDGDGISRLYTIPAAGVFESPLPLPAAVQASVAPDRKRLAYLPKSLPINGLDSWRYYRGGRTSPLWIADLGDLRVQPVTTDAANARYPMWVRDRIYFVSDETGTFNLYEYDTTRRRTRPLTRFTSHGIEGAAATNEAIAFVRGGRIHVFDLSAEMHREVAFSLAIEAPELTPKSVAASRFVETIEYIADDDAIVGARGDVYRFNRQSGNAQGLTNTPAAAERYPTLSPDGHRLAFFSDESGEYSLHIKRLASGDTETIRVEAQPSFYRELTWSPDSTSLAFSDIRLGLWIARPDTGSVRKIDSSRYIAQGEYRPDWSPDGRYLSYAKARGDGLRAAYIYDAADSRVHQVSDGLTHVESPVFDRDGRYLYFISSSNARLAAASDIGWGLLSSELARPLVRRSLHALILRAGDLAPGAATNTESKEVSGFSPTAPRRQQASTAIDFNDLSRRVVRLQTGVRDYASLRAGAAGQLFVRVNEWPFTPGAGGPAGVLYAWDVTTPTRLQKLADTVAESWSVSHDRRSVVYASGPDRFSVGPGGKPARFELQRIQVQVDPRLEWRQMYQEAWRQMRDTFYDPNHHGQDLQQLARDYAALLPSVTRRTYLNRLFVRMLGNVSVSHLQIGGGDVVASPGASPPVGDIGADFVVEQGRYRFTKIIRSPHFSVAVGLLNAPLDQPGVDIREGDFLIGVDGQAVDISRNVYSLFEGKVGRPVTLSVSASPSGEGARTFTIVPNAGTGALRNYHRGEENRRRVDALSGGRVGYVYIEGYDPVGLEGMMRAMVAMRDRHALIIDQRYNGGGTTSDTLVEMLNRTPMYDYAYRYGDGFEVPAVGFSGPKVLITNETNFSAAETFALMFKLTRTGTIVGRRTGGGGIGAALFQPPLVDGGRIGIPNRASYNPAGTWDIENHGVVPDVDVDILPRDWKAGRDPQLDKAVEVALAAAKRAKPPERRRPAYPVHPR